MTNAFLSPRPAAPGAGHRHRSGRRSPRQPGRPASGRIARSGSVIVAGSARSAPAGAATYDQAAALIRLDPGRWTGVAALAPEADETDWLEAEIALRLLGFSALCVDVRAGRARLGASACLRLVERAAGLCRRTGAALLIDPADLATLSVDRPRQRLR